MKHARLLSLLLAALLVLSSCSISMADSLEDAAEVSVDTSEMFTDRDLEIGYDEEDSAYITLQTIASPRLPLPWQSAVTPLQFREKASISSPALCQTG